MLKSDKLYHCITLLVCVSVIISCGIVSVYADNIDDDSARSDEYSSVYNDYYTDVKVTPIIQTLPEGNLVEVNKVKAVVTPSDTNGLKAILLSMIGDYETVVTDYTYQSTNGYYSHSIQIERDWAWLASAFIFVVVLYCTFRGVVAILCRTL